MMQWSCFCLWFFYQLQCIYSVEIDAFGLPSVTSQFEEKYYVVPDIRIHFNLTCEATGDPTPSVTWLKNGQLFSDTIRSQVTSVGILVILEADSSTLGTYQCRATNAKGVSISPGVSVNKAVLGSFSQSQELRRVSEDRYKYLAFPCTDRPICEPESACRFEWKRRSGEGIVTEERIFVDTEGTLHILYLDQPDDKETYTCGVWNEQLRMHGRSRQTTELTITYDNAQRTYPPALVFSKNVTGKITHNTRLQCVFSGHPLPNIVWLDTDGEVIIESDVYSFHDNRRTLVISSLTADHEGMYTCNGLQQTSGARAGGKVYLNVTGPPIFEPGAMEDQVLTVGSNAQYSCSSRSLPNESDPETPVWYQNAQEITVFGPGEKFSRNGMLLTVNRLEKNDTSLIQCEVGNSEGRSFREAQLIVIDPITILEGLPKIVEVAPNTSLSVRVAAITDTRLSLTYDWSFLDNGVWTSLPTGVVTSDDLQNVTFNPNQSSVRKIIGVYKVVIAHAFDSVMLETNLITTGQSTITGIPQTAATTTEPTTTITSTTTTATTTTTSTTTTPSSTTTDATTTKQTTKHTSTTTRSMMTPARPPTGSREDEPTDYTPVVVIVVIAIAIIVASSLIIAVLYRKRRNQDKLTINQPSVTPEAPPNP